MWILTRELSVDTEFRIIFSVIPAQAGIQLPFWVPAFAGTTRPVRVTFFRD